MGLDEEARCDSEMWQKELRHPPSISWCEWYNSARDVESKK